MIKFYYGCMGSGKSLHLLASAHNFQEHNIPFVILKSEIDTRDGENVIHSRALGDRECLSIDINTDIYVLISRLISTSKALYMPDLKWILVDEAQFLTPQQVEQLAALADTCNVKILCYGLRTDFQTNLFPGSKRLFELADSIEEIKSSCFCDSKTLINARINEKGEIITEGEQVEVGGDDKYISLCRSCYFKKTNNRYYTKKENDDND